MRSFYHTCKFSALTMNFSEVRPRQILDLGKQFNLVMSLKRLKGIFARRIQNVLKTSWRHFCRASLKTSWRCLEAVFKDVLQNVLKTTWRRLQDAFWRRMTRANIFVLIKTSWRCLQDVFWRRRQKTSSRRLHQDECLQG